MFDFNKNAFSPAGWATCSREQFDQLIDDPLVTMISEELLTIGEEYRAGRMDEDVYNDRKSSLKKRLPAFAFHAHFPDGHRRNEGAQPSGLCMIDLDHLAAPRALWRKLYTQMKEQQEQHLDSRSDTRLDRLMLAHITPSGSGLRMVWRLPKRYRHLPYGTNLADFQQGVHDWIAISTNTEPNGDPHVKDLARISFAVPRKFILHFDEALFDQPEAGRESSTSTEEDERGESRDENGPDPAANDAHHSPLPSATLLPLGNSNEFDCARLPAAFTIHHSPKKNPCDPLQGLMGQIGQAVADYASPAVPMAPYDGAFPTSPSIPAFKGMPYADIISRYWQFMGGPPAPGERNTKLHQLAYHLRYICDFDADLLRKVMPTYGLSTKEMDDLIRSALKAPRFSYSNVMNKVLAECNLPESVIPPEEGLDADPPTMPADLPPLIELLVRYMPEAYKPAVAHGVFPPLATHLSDVRFRYLDNVEHEATLMCLLMAGSSAGKGCMQRPIQYLMADIRKRDDESLQKEKEWKQACSRLGANERKPARPEGLIVQEVDPDMTNPAFVQRMADAAPSPLYASMNEVEQFDNLRSSSGGKQQFQIMCYAFDPGNRYGQTRVSSNAVTEKVTVRFNWNASTTVNKGQRYFKNVVNDGPLSRINLCTIMPQAIGEQMPVYGIYPDDYPQQLQPYLDKLCQARGLIDIPQATDFAQRLVDHNALISSETQNRTYEQLSFRAAVIAWLKACVLYVAQGNYWDERIEQFCLWSMDYDLWCKMRFFSQAMEEAIKSEQVTTWKKNSLLNSLGETFTEQDLRQLRLRNGLNPNCGSILRVWAFRKLVRKNPDGTFTNLHNDR